MIGFTNADTGQPEVQATIRKNERTAREAMQLIAKRNRKAEGHILFENMLNVIGIMAAEMVGDADAIDGPDFAQAVRDVIVTHTDHALKQVKERQA